MFFFYFVNNQIWLNQLMDDHHLDYITNWKKKAIYVMIDIERIHSLVIT
jgi:hypothetical protein